MGTKAESQYALWKKINHVKASLPTKITFGMVIITKKKLFVVMLGRSTGSGISEYQRKWTTQCEDINF